jgi:zinc transport system substrate-binding protein
MRAVLTFLLLATPALAKVPSVVTDIPPVQSLVAQVMGDLGQPVLLLAKGADEHDFQLRPSQARAVADADLVVWIGPELTPWLESAMDARTEGAAALELLHTEATSLQPYAVAEGEEGHDHDGTDPHAWLDPANAKVWLGLIAAELSRLDPEHAAIYAANAAAATEDISTLDTELATILAPMKGKPIVTFHAAYGYFAAHYGLTLVGSIAVGDAASPGAKHLQALRATMEAGAVLCIFPEIQHDPDLVRQLAEGTGAKTGGALDPVGSSLEPGPGAYAALLIGMARIIADCAGR